MVLKCSFCKWSKQHRCRHLAHTQISIHPTVWSPWRMRLLWGVFPASAPPASCSPIASAKLPNPQASQTLFSSTRCIAGPMLHQDTSRHPTAQINKHMIKSTHEESHRNIFLKPCGKSCNTNLDLFSSACVFSFKANVYMWPVNFSYIFTLQLFHVRDSYSGSWQPCFCGRGWAWCAAGELDGADLSDEAFPPAAAGCAPSACPAHSCPAPTPHSDLTALSH